MSVQIESYRSSPSNELQFDRCITQSFEISDYFAKKELIVRAIGLILFIVAAPIILILAIIMRLTSPGHPIYGQVRSGKNGKDFTLYKIRTMDIDAEKCTGPVWCQPGDSRVTLIGRVLRFLHWDELPQLFNVARGEMDLIGPRPERPEIIEELLQNVPDFSERLVVRPGITGLAQVNLAPDATVDCARRKLALDLEYIQSASLGMDLRLLLCTALRMLGVRHGRAALWLGLSRDASLVETRLPLNDIVRVRPKSAGAVARAAKVASVSKTRSERHVSDVGLRNEDGLCVNDPHVDLDLDTFVAGART